MSCSNLRIFRSVKLKITHLHYEIKPVSGLGAYKSEVSSIWIQKDTNVKTEQAKELVVLIIAEALGDQTEISEDMQLIGGDTLLDSMKLVEVCLALEDKAQEHNFEFDWTSEAAMSKSRSMFRNVAALVDEFARQSEV